MKDRILSLVRKDQNGCWVFQGNIGKFGYGRLEFRGVPWKAHRLSWTAFKGSIPDGLFVLHKCDNPPCCNPDHLFLGTQRDNIEDAISKGRLDVRSAQLLGAVAKRKKTDTITAPRVISGIADMIRSGVKPTQRACRSIPGFKSITRYFSQGELVSRAKKIVWSA